MNEPNVQPESKILIRRQQRMASIVLNHPRWQLDTIEAVGDLDLKL